MMTQLFKNAQLLGQKNITKQMITIQMQIYFERHLRFASEYLGMVTQWASDGNVNTISCSANLALWMCFQIRMPLDNFASFYIEGGFL